MIIKEEIFKDISGFEGLYQIGNRGTVRSLTFRNNKTTFEKKRTMKPFDNGNGYLVVSLRKGGKRKNFYIHRLVAKAFLYQQEGKDVVNHKDHNTYNNCFENLEWCTQKENVRLSASRMRHEKSKCRPTNTGEKYVSKHKNSYRLQIKQKGIYRQFKTLEEAREFKRVMT